MLMIKARSISQSSFQVQFNWMSVVLVSLIVTFGFFAYGSQDLNKFSLNLAFPLVALIIMLVSLIIVLVSLGPIYQRIKNVSFDDSITITFLDFLFFLIILLFTIIINWDWITRSLTGDELAYAGIASNQSLQIFNLIPYSSETIASGTVLRLISAMITILLAVSIWILLKLCWKRQVLFSLLAISILQLVVGFLGGTGFGYTKLNTFPYFLTTSIFGFSDTTYRVTSIFIFSFFMMLIFKALVTWFQIPALVAASICLALGSIPLMSHHAVIVEHSVFFFLFSSLPLLEVVRSQNYRPERWVPFLVVGTYFRFTVALSLIVYIIYGLLSSKKNRKRITKVIPIVLALVPYAIGLILWPSGGAVGENSFSGFATNDMTLRFDVIKSALAVSIDKPAIVLAVIGLIVWLSTSLTLFFCATTYITFAWIVYYEFTKSVLLGFPKYQEEWVPVLLLVGFISIYKLFQQIFTKAASNSLVLTFLFVMVLFNILENQTLPSRNTFVNKQESLGKNELPFSIANVDSHYVLSVIPLPIKEALLSAKKLGFGGNCFLSGAVYNVMPEILFGSSVSDTRQSLDLRNKVVESQNFLKSDWISIDSDSLRRANAECVILTYLPDIEKVERNLSVNGWSKRDTLYDSGYSTSTSIWVKELSNNG